MKLTFKGTHWIQDVRAVDKDFDRLLQTETPWRVVAFIDEIIKDAERLKAIAEAEWQKRYEDSLR